MEIVIRSAAIFVFLTLLMRFMGRRELSEMTSFELVLLVTMGDLVQQGVTQEDMSFTGAVLAVGTIGALIVLTSYTAFRIPGTRRVLDGISVVVVRDGRILDDIVKIERLTRDEILEAARQRGIGDIDHIKVGILESDGRFSFVLDSGKPMEQPQGHTG